MSFEELGLILRQQRERRGLSVEEVADRLKLMPRIVRAIEQADIEALPQAAYARGFVKAYGNLLELEPELLYAGMEDAWPDDSHQPPIPYEPAQERKSGVKGRLATFIFLMLILAAAAGIWFFRDLDLRLPSGILLKAEPAISAKSELSPSLPQAKSGPPPESRNQTVARQTNMLRGASPDPAAAAFTPSGQPALPAVPADSRPAENAPAAAPQAAPLPAESSVALQGGQHNLIIIALAECWVHSNADSTDTRQFSLRKGDTFALTFSKKLLLKLGNAGGVRIRLDGRDLDPPGEMGQVKTLTFPANP
jgi:cytoskeleton protein RodZ